MKLIIPFIISIACVNAVGQDLSLDKIEYDLIKSYTRIKSFRIGADTIAWDSIEHENLVFGEKIKNYTAKYPQTLNYKFDKLMECDFAIVTSEDGLFRIYSWNTHMGGTMIDFANIYQYKAGDKVYSKLLTSSFDGEQIYVPYYEHIYSLKMDDKSCYLAFGKGVYSSKDFSEYAKVFCIEGSSLNDTLALFKTEEGFVNSIEVFFD